MVVVWGMVTQINLRLSFPEVWSRALSVFETLVSQTNKLLSANLHTQAVDNIFELIYGCMEYLEEDVRLVVQAGDQNPKSNARVKAYQDQLLQFSSVLEEISWADPEADQN